MELWGELAHSCFWWWPYENVCFVSDKPKMIKRNERGQLHSENGLALQFHDGYGMFCWHGTRVKEKLIMRPNEITREEILNEKNSEVSRAMMEKLGARYFELFKPKLIHKWFDEKTSCHYELCDIEDRPQSDFPFFLKMESPELKDGTRPYYIERVPPGIKTCQAARRWQCDPEIIDLCKRGRNEIMQSVKICNENPELVFEMEK